MNQTQRLFAACAFALLLTMPLQAQRGGRGGNGNANAGEIRGRIVTSPDNKALSFATVRLYSASDSVMQGGASSGEDGSFTLERVPFGDYYLTIKFIGFSSKRVDGVVVGPRARRVDLGDILLDADQMMTESVVVEARKHNVEYKIDRKVINVDNDLAASSGTAVDVLENVPSVQVDIDGNVSLRGNTGFIVMIDGRPSVLDANDALKQIPASSIENIEIITNPSARYDPDGTVGILNIVLKKQAGKGNSSLFSLDVGQYDRLGGSALYNVQNESFNMFFSADYSSGSRPGTELNRRETYVEDLTTFLASEGDGERSRETWGLRAGIESSISAGDKLNFQAEVGGRGHESDNNLQFTEYSSIDPTETVYSSTQSHARKGMHYSSTLDYTRTFDSPRHTLTASLDYQRREGDEDSKDEMFDIDGTRIFASAHTEDGPSERLRSSLDYVLPFSESHKLETGYQGRYGLSEDVTQSFGYDVDASDFFREDEYSYTTEYVRNIHALYAMYGGEYGDLGYQAGLRLEYTDRSVETQDGADVFTIDRWDLFPSLHFSYNLGDNLQGILSYSRRIERPRSWYLEPFTTRTDAFNYRRGNPELEPQYSDSYELGLMKHIGRTSLSLEVFHRRNENEFERVRTLLDDTLNIFLNTIDNVGDDAATGFEAMADMKLFDFWGVSLSTSVFQFDIEKYVNGRTEKHDSFNWTGRIKNDIDLGENTSFELTLNFDSPSATSQGEREGNFVTNAALRQMFFDKSLTAILQVRDLFDTANEESTAVGNGFYSYSLEERAAPVVSLTLRYNLNNFRQKREGGGDDGDDF